MLTVIIFCRKVYLPDEDSKQVIIYTTSWCGYCAALRANLTKSEIPYVERNIETSWHGRIGFLVLGGKGVPVSVIGPEIIYGYNLRAIQLNLKTLGYQLKL